MEKIINILLFTTAFSLSFSTVDPYTKAMSEGIVLLEQARDSDDYLAVANQFERISKVAKDKWQPPYYAAYGRAVAASMINDLSLIDELLDQAELSLKKASDLDHDESEVVTLQGFIHMLRIAVDPGTRGQQYSMMSSAALQKALVLNPENPRAMYMQAQLSYGTAQFFGSDTSEACAAAARAIELFEENEQKNATDPFAPTWGKPFALSFQKLCKE